MPTTNNAYRLLSYDYHRHPPLACRGRSSRSIPPGGCTHPDRRKGCPRSTIRHSFIRYPFVVSSHKLSRPTNSYRFYLNNNRPSIGCSSLFWQIGRSPVSQGIIDPRCFDSLAIHPSTRELLILVVLRNCSLPIYPEKIDPRCFRLRRRSRSIPLGQAATSSPLLVLGIGRLGDTSRRDHAIDPRCFIKFHPTLSHKPKIDAFNSKFQPTPFFEYHWSQFLSPGVMYARV